VGPERRSPRSKPVSESQCVFEPRAAERRYERLDWDTLCAHTTHLILFSLEVTANGHVSALDRLPSRAELEAARVAAQKHGTKLLLCFGGNGRSEGFAAMVKSKETRRSFLTDVAKLLELNGLHGVDYNWEYPHGKQQWEGLAT
jgi:chitinase